MYENQEIIAIEKNQLSEKVREFFKEGYRLVQMNCTKEGEAFCLDYSFDKDKKFINLRLMLPIAEAKMHSISEIYMPACLYENEIHDLFGIDYSDLAIDFKGRFYRIDEKAPFNSEAAN